MRICARGTGIVGRCLDLRWTQHIDSDCCHLSDGAICRTDGANQMGSLDRDHNRVDWRSLESVDCPTAENDRCHVMSYVRKFISSQDAWHNWKISWQSLGHIYLHK
jgi:hypothetical protein